MDCWEVSSLSIAGSLATLKQTNPTEKVGLWGPEREVFCCWWRCWFPYRNRVGGVRFAGFKLEKQPRLSSQALTTIEFCPLVKTSDDHLEKTIGRNLVIFFWGGVKKDNFGD